jgi:CRISPR/Cas system-associated protein Cas10 (large subunit of type III CRISPR-Cas system)
LKQNNQFLASYQLKHEDDEQSIFNEIDSRCIERTKRFECYGLKQKSGSSDDYLGSVLAAAASAAPAAMQWSSPRSRFASSISRSARVSELLHQIVYRPRESDPVVLSEQGRQLYSQSPGNDIVQVMITR